MSTVEYKETPPPDFNLSAEQIENEIFSTVLRLQRAWEDNLQKGIGALGSHGGPYVNTGEAVQSIRIDPERPGAKEYSVYSDKVQTLIAEVGRAPGKKPPYRPISQWVHEKLGVKRDEPEHYPIVQAIRRNIAERGLQPFAPMEKAIIDTIRDLEERLGRAMEG